jgi:hypothetical protein
LIRNGIEQVAAIFRRLARSLGLVVGHGKSPVGWQRFTGWVGFAVVCLGYPKAVSGQFSTIFLTIFIPFLCIAIRKKPRAFLDLFCPTILDGSARPNYDGALARTPTATQPQGSLTR